MNFSSKMMFLTIVALAMVGCGGNGLGMVEVSGVVMVDGQPTEGIEVIFMPQPTKDSSNVGPISTGVTGADGTFTLTAKGVDGAVAGTHKVSCQYASFNPSATINLTAELSEAKRNKKSTTDIQSKLAAAKKAKALPARFNYETTLRIDVPTEGLKDYKIEVASE